MRHIRRYLVILVITLVVSGLFVPMNTQAQDTAQKPTWEKGDEWSMGYHIEDVEKKFEPGIHTANDQLVWEQAVNQEIDDLDFSMSGKMGFYQIYKVTEVGSDEYTMKIKAGGGIHLKGSLMVKGEFPKEGEYTADSRDQLPTTTKTVEASGDLDYSLDMSGTAHLRKSDLAMKDMSIEMTHKLKASFKGSNIPQTSEYSSGGYHDTEVTRDTTYKDYDVSASGDVTIELDMQFSPALDIFDFPISEGESWDIESTMTVSGQYSGEIDANGLPQEIKSSLDAQGISLPAKLADIDTGSSDIHDGVIEETSGPIRMKGECTGTDQVVLEDGSTTKAFLISYHSAESGYESQYAEGYESGYEEGKRDQENGYGYSNYYDSPSDDDHYGRGRSNGYDDGYYNNPYDATCPYDYSSETFHSFKYSPEEGFFVSEEFQPSSISSGTGSSIPVSSIMNTDSDGLEMEPMSEDKAEDNMESMQKMDEEEKSLLEKLLSPPLIYVIVGVIGAVIVIALIALKKKGGQDPERYGPPPQQQQYGRQQDDQGQGQQGPYQEYEDRGYRRTDQRPQDQQPQDDWERDQQF